MVNALYIMGSRCCNTESEQYGMQVETLGRYQLNEGMRKRRDHFLLLHLISSTCSKCYFNSTLIMRGLVFLASCTATILQPHSTKDSARGVYQADNIID